MKVKIIVAYEMEFDSDKGDSKTNVSFKLPDHPQLPISDTVKKLAVEETAMLANAMLSRGVFEPDFVSTETPKPPTQPLTQGPAKS